MYIDMSVFIASHTRCIHQADAYNSYYITRLTYFLVERSLQSCAVTVLYVKHALTFYLLHTDPGQGVCVCGGGGGGGGNVFASFKGLLMGGGGNVIILLCRIQEKAMSHVTIIF